MAWMGEKVRTLSRERQIPLKRIAEIVGVSRQSVNDWINGQIPKGNHLVSLCKILDVNADIFFSDETGENISMPVHRVRKRAKIDPTIQKDALEIVKQYEILFKNITSSLVVPVIRITDRSEKSAIEIARQLRDLSGIAENMPLDYNRAFKLLQKLGIVAVFKYFPENIKTYAFYTKIYGHRVVFVNNHTNLLDLIFPLLHESVHAIRDEVYTAGFYDNDEEDFCDTVANYVQFPNSYVELVHDTIKWLKPGQKVNKLKMFGNKHSHSLFGIVKRIKSISPSFKLNVGGADTNLKKQFSPIGELLFQNDDPVEFINIYQSLSPMFVKIIRDQIKNISYRKLGELFDKISILDAKEIKAALLK
jgi:transcriptional regulator with XRE-family HTH domain